MEGRSIRILVASGEWFPDRQGGFARVVTDTTRALSERGHEIVALVPRGVGQPTVVREGTLTIERALTRSRLPVTFNDPWQIWRHARRIDGLGFDVLLAHGATAAAALVATRLDVPLALVYHASAPREVRFLRSTLRSRSERLSSLALLPLLALYERLAVNRASRILTLSEFSRSLLRQDHPTAVTRSRCVWGGVDVIAFSPSDGPAAARRRLGVDPELPLLLTVRRLEPRMGIDRLLLAFSRLLRERRLALTIVGTGASEAELRSIASRLDLGDRVRFAGSVPDERLRDWYRAADLFVLPTIAYEGFGMVTAESLACGTPVVGTPVGATPELLNPLDPRLLSAGTDPDSLAAAIAEALAFVGPDFRRRCRDFAVERFSWDRAIVAWEAALREAADERTP